jgi:thioredoxin reductase
MSGLVDVAVVGSGPSGLSVSAHLTAHGIEHRIFGPPMRFWHNMPVGIFLKSLDFASDVYTPRRGFTFIEYCKMHGLSSQEPVPMSVFAGYGMWAQGRLVPHVEPVEVTRIARSGGVFEIELANGHSCMARRVVVATGLSHFAHMPEELRGLPRELVTHSSDHLHYKSFPGKEVVVLGRGSSAVEAACLLREAGCRAELMVRGSDELLFAGPPKNPRPLRDRILYPMSVLGPGRLNFALDKIPFGLHHLPDRIRVHVTRNHLGPWGPWWLAQRFEGKVPVIPYNQVIGGKPRGSRVEIRVKNTQTGEVTERVVDHVIAGTGYHPDVDRIPFIERDLAARIARIDRGPRVDSHFQTSVPGLYFVGPATALSFGPLVRFISGARDASRSVARHITDDIKRSPRVWQVPFRADRAPQAREQRDGAGRVA